jgi:hypothetical protein
MYFSLSAMWEVSCVIYRMFQEERWIFGEVIVSVILGRKVYMYMCSIPNGFRDRAISLYRRSTRHVLTRVAIHCTDEQHAMSSHELQRHWYWRRNFRKCIILDKLCRPQLPRGLRHGLSSLARTLGSWVRIPLKEWMCVRVYSVFVLFCVYVAALQWADPPAKESYRLCKKIKKLKKRPGSSKGP